MSESSSENVGEPASATTPGEMLATPSAAPSKKKEYKRKKKNFARVDHAPVLQPGTPGWCQTWFNFPLFGVAVGTSPKAWNSRKMCVIVGGGGAGRNGVPNGIYVTCLDPSEDGDGALVLRSEGHAILDTGPDLPFAVAVSSKLGLVACSFGGSVQLYALRNSEVGIDLVAKFQADYGDLPDIALVRFNEEHDSHGGQEGRILTCGSDRTVRVYSIQPVGDSKAKVTCDAELESSSKDINDIHSCSFRGSDGKSWLGVAVASDDGKVYLWSVSSSTACKSPTPNAICNTIEDGNNHPRAGGRIFKNVRFSHTRANGEEGKSNDGTLLFAIQSRMNRGNSYLVVWKRKEGAELTEMQYSLVSQTKLFAGSGDKAVKLDVPRRRSSLDPYVVCIGSAGGRVCAMQVNPNTGATSMLGEELRHSLVVSGLAAMNLRKETYILTTAMDKGVVLQPVRGLVASASKRYRKRCCVILGVIMVLLAVAFLGAWKSGFIPEEQIKQVSTIFGGDSVSYRDNSGSATLHHDVASLDDGSSIDSTGNNNFNNDEENPSNLSEDQIQLPLESSSQNGDGMEDVESKKTQKGEQLAPVQNIAVGVVDEIKPEDPAGVGSSGDETPNEDSHLAESAGGSGTSDERNVAPETIRDAQDSKVTDFTSEL